jgi:hypothetical protein
MPRAGKPSKDDAEARKTRAARLRAGIDRLTKGRMPKPSSPRELTDEAASEARAKAEKRRDKR